MAGIAVGGLASGLDTETLILRLMAIERQPLARVELAQKRAEGRKAALDEIATRLRTFKTAAADLRSVATWSQVQTLTSSDPARVAVRQTTTAPPGTYAIEVQSLARAEQRTYDYTSSAVLPSDITVNGVSVSVAAGGTVEDAARAINGKADMAVIASVANGQLVLSAKELGTQITVSSLTSSVAEDATRAKPRQAAQWTLDGVAQTAVYSNTVSSASLPGIELDLKGVTTAAITVTVGEPGVDVERVKGKVKAFAEAYNGLVDHVRSKLSEKRVADPRLPSDFAKGALRGDTALSGMLSQMRIAVSSPIAGLSSSLDELAEIGVAVPPTNTGPVTAERLSGKLAIDDAKLTAALTNSPDAVKAFLGAVAGQSGFAQRIEGIVDPLATTGTGILPRRSAEADTEVARHRRRAADLEVRLDGRERRLREQFTRLETALGASQAQMGWLQGQLAGLS